MPPCKREGGLCPSGAYSIRACADGWRDFAHNISHEVKGLLSSWRGDKKAYPAAGRFGLPRRSAHFFVKDFSIRSEWLKAALYQLGLAMRTMFVAANISCMRGILGATRSQELETQR